ncbi:hypothetical protein EPA93_39035 [Ktedonosporobacter rubrisoli]|uniref:Uncharacterized protein n=1 Tax=Ktedonosporobacter rubrisoli TaxID=2509675 RepID=A0A4P6K0D5_KTERU|nr:hypothetical protein [Ktedonosporobacter rubrisoli]QBD81648.1 hypothetical protein EPA93_39035 [Ktedonosporobacter rubrisoli]
MVKKSVSTWLSVIATLEIITLAIGAYTYTVMRHMDHRHVWLATLALAVYALIVGTLVTRSKAQIVSYILLGLGLIGLSIGTIFVKIMVYHERAELAFGIGILSLAAGLIGVLLPRSIKALFIGMSIIGTAFLLFGLYLTFRFTLHGRTYIVLGTGGLYLLGGLIGIAATTYRTQASLLERSLRR